MMPLSETRYTTLSSEDERWNEPPSKQKKPLYDSFQIFKTALFMIFAFAVGVIVGIAVSPVGFGECPSINELSNPCEDNTASAPVWTDGIRDIQTRWTRFNGSLYGKNKYRGEPSSELDAAWDRFTDHEFMPGTPLILGVGAEELRLSRNNFSLETVVKLEVDNGGGGYMASIEMFHQLHCLNVLRKWTHKDYYQRIDDFWKEENKYHLREHTGHCIDMLRQVLMCQSDTGLVVFHWTKKVSSPTPYFSTSHRCRDPEQVLQWAQGIAKPVNRHIYKKGDEIELENFPGS